MRFQKCDERCIHRRVINIKTNQIRCAKAKRFTVRMKTCPGADIQKVKKDV